MQIYDQVLRIIDANIIYGLPGIVITLFVAKQIAGKKIKTSLILNWVRWIIIGYTSIKLVEFSLQLLFSDNSEEVKFLKRATGPYFVFDCMQIIFSMLLPFTLIVKSLSRKYIYIFLISLLMKLGFNFERFVIIVTSYHRDYIADGFNSTDSLPILLFFTPWIQGSIVTILLLLIVYIIYPKEYFIDQNLIDR
ncbi:MAG: hypothetical protein P8Q42_03890 [Flavobacteriales bacterium]|nr:hypothetical protein [Flavobacteriales bacterium]